MFRAICLSTVKLSGACPKWFWDRRTLIFFSCVHSLKLSIISMGSELSKKSLCFYRYFRQLYCILKYAVFTACFYPFFQMRLPCVRPLCYLTTAMWLYYSYEQLNGFAKTDICVTLHPTELDSTYLRLIVRDSQALISDFLGIRLKFIFLRTHQSFNRLKIWYLFTWWQQPSCKSQAVSVCRMPQGCGFGHADVLSIPLVPLPCRERRRKPDPRLPGERSNVLRLHPWRCPLPTFARLEFTSSARQQGRCSAL